MKLICLPFIASQSIVNVVSKGKSGMSDSRMSETATISSFSPSRFWRERHDFKTPGFPVFWSNSFYIVTEPGITHLNGINERLARYLSPWVYFAYSASLSISPPWHREKKKRPTLRMKQSFWSRMRASWRLPAEVTLDLIYEEVFIKNAHRKTKNDSSKVIILESGRKQELVL